MKIAFFQFFPQTIWTPGGGETQLIKTKEALERIGVQVELFDIWSRRRDYDILHVFGSSYQLSDFVVTAKKLGMKVVVSPIAYTNKPKYLWKMWNLIDYLLPVPTLYTYRKRIYEAADVLLPNSRGEAKQLATNFGISKKKMIVVPNGVDKRFADATPDVFFKKYGLKDFILEVGRISTHKGQNRLIHALDGTNLELVIIGQPDPDDPSGFKEFKRLAKTRPWIHYLEFIPHDSPLLASAYAAAKVHVLPSLGETSPLVNLEAGLARANVVTLKNSPIYEYLGDHAFYCNPCSISSIRNSVLRAYETPKSEKLRKLILEHFTWDRIAKKTLEVYKNLLQN